MPVAVAPSPQNFVLDSQLGLYLPLWDARLTGSPILSEDIYSRSWTVIGAVKGPQGRTFVGGDDWLVHATNANFDWMHGAVDATGFQWTVLVWVKLTNPFSDASQTFFGNARYGTVDIGVTVGFDNRSAVPASRRLRMSISNGGAEVCILSSADNVYPNDSGFHLVAYTYNQTPANSNAKIYMDSALVATGNKTANVPSSATSTFTPHIGSDGNETSRTGGVMGEITIYQRKFTITEISNYSLATKWRYS